MAVFLVVLVVTLVGLTVGILVGSPSMSSVHVIVTVVVFSIGKSVGSLTMTRVHVPSTDIGVTVLVEVGAFTVLLVMGEGSIVLVTIGVCGLTKAASDSTRPLSIIGGTIGEPHDTLTDISAIDEVTLIGRASLEYELSLTMTLPSSIHSACVCAVAILNCFDLACRLGLLPLELNRLGALWHTFTLSVGTLEEGDVSWQGDSSISVLLSVQELEVSDSNSGFGWHSL